MNWHERELSPAHLAAYLTQPTAIDNKYDRGVLGVLAGSPRFPGAALLNIEAAIRAGAGMVRYLGEQSLVKEIIAARPETVIAPGPVDAYLIGSGLITNEVSERDQKLILAALETELPVILDAGAMLFARKVRKYQLLTPHAGELSKLFAAWGRNVSSDEIEARPAEFVQLAAEMINSDILLKGNTTYIASYWQKEILTISDLPTQLATAGSGDVLAGIIGALIVQHPPQNETEFVEITALAVVLHAAAARSRTSGPIAALDIAQNLPETIAKWRTGDFTTLTL